MTKQTFTDLRTLAGIAITFAGLVALLMLVSCAPKPTERVYPMGKTDFGPLQKDPVLKLGGLHAASVADLKWDDTVESARVFRFGETMMELGALTNSPELSQLGRRVGSEFYGSHGTATHTTFNDSLYITAAIGETKEDVVPVIDQNDSMLAKQLPMIRSILKTTSATFPWPSADTPPRPALAMAKVYAQQFIEKVKDSDVDPTVESGIESAFATDLFPLFDSLTNQIDSILAEQDSVVMIDRLKSFAAKNGLNLGDDTNKMIDQARDVFVQIKEIDHSQDALKVIVELWTLTPEDAREKTFKPVSEDLYNFLKDKGPHSLACVKSAGCLSPIIFLEKQLFILPALQKYGLDKLQAQIEQAAHDALVKEITSAIASFVPTIPQQIDSKISDQLGAFRKKLASVKSDYGSFIHSIAQEFEKQNLRPKEGPTEDSERITGLEANKVHIDLNQNHLDISQAAPQATSTTGAEVLGDSMSYAASVWAQDNSGSISYQKSVISQINKMLALGGFETPSKKTYDSLAVSVDPSVAMKHFDVRNDLGGTTPFAVPDTFGIQDVLTPVFSSAPKSVSIKGQAELLRGLAAMARYLQDWKQNAYDSSIGSVEVGKLIKDLPAGSVTSKLFPKDSFFALSVANAATILVNLTKTLSPVFTIDITNKATWADARSDEPSQPAVMAAVVDIQNGKRSATVHSADAARFLLAIADFLDATEGIENTKAHPLITPGTDGKRPIDQLGDARKQLEMLIVGIGNFLSHEMATKDGGIRPTFRQDTMKVDAHEPRHAIDQALTILALLRASDVLGKDVYAWSALDAYAWMNSALFNSSKGFYVASEGSTDLPSTDDVATILLAGQTLRSHMSLASQQQWDMISTPWLSALKGLN